MTNDRQQLPRDPHVYMTDPYRCLDCGGGPDDPRHRGESEMCTCGPCELFDPPTCGQPRERHGVEEGKSGHAWQGTSAPDCPQHGHDEVDAFIEAATGQQPDYRERAEVWYSEHGYSPDDDWVNRGGIGPSIDSLTDLLQVVAAEARAAVLAEVDALADTLRNEADEMSTDEASEFDNGLGHGLIDAAYRLRQLGGRGQ